MIRNLQRWQQWQDAHIASEPPDPGRAFVIAEALNREAKALGVWDQPFTVENIRHKIDLARVLHVSETTRATGE